MISTVWLLITSVMAVTVAHPLVGQATDRMPDSSTRDSGFPALQARGKTAMGVDQYASVHHFDDLPDGGRIELQAKSTDTVAVRAIRGHLQAIAQAFAAGDFRTPGFVHAGQVPGTAVMTAQRRHIAYRFNPLPGGGEVRILTTTPEAVKAVHSFLAFQRQEHHAAGREMRP
jgi:hypothetical protein